MDLLAPGFHQVPGKFELAVTMTRIMFPFLLLVALAAQAMGMLNACNRSACRPWRPRFSISDRSASGWWRASLLGPYLHIDKITGMAIGVVLGGALQLVWQMPSLGEPWLSLSAHGRLVHPGCARSCTLMVPGHFGQRGGADQRDGEHQLRLAHPDATDPVSWLGYAFRFMQFPLGLFGVAIASATLPSISRSAAAGNMDEFRRTLSQSLGMVFLLTLPARSDCVLGKSMIGAIYQGGKFSAYDTHQTALALSCYAIGLAGYAALKVLSPAFYALNDARTPMLVSLASILVNYFAASWMSARLGFAGLALSTSVVALFGALALFAILRNRIHGVYGRDLASSILKIVAASVVMGVAVWGADALIAGHIGTGRIGDVSNLLISMPLGAIVFYLACRLLRVSELELASRGVSSSLKSIYFRKITPN